MEVYQNLLYTLRMPPRRLIKVLPVISGVRKYCILVPFRTPSTKAWLVFGTRVEEK